MAKKQWFGKYRAKVVALNDPEKRGRIRVLCPKVLGKASSAWCEVCMPVAYDNGGDFYLPRVNETVWVEFEDGDSNKPIWVGGWWSKEKTPVADYSEASTIRTIEFNGAKISFTTNSITLTAGGSSIVIGANIAITSAGRIDLN